jgi:HTH-type transcriptional regulator, sugar sensing transcriptional regulator
MTMNRIPEKLTHSLMQLGLLESEAKIYAALVLKHDSEVKELQEFLGMSKPSVYEGLRTLEEKGFVILTNPKPTTYQAIPPEVALDMRLVAQMKAKEEALKSIHDLQDEQGEEHASENVWFIFGTRHFESKVKDMLRSAKKSVFCVTSGQYLDLIEQKAKSNLGFDLTIITEDLTVQQRLDGVFRKDKANIRIISKGQMIGSLVAQNQGSEEASVTSKDKLLGKMEIDKMFVLLVDDEEMFYIPPMKGMSSNAIATKNQLLIFNMKNMGILRDDGTSK